MKDLIGLILAVLILFGGCGSEPEAAAVPQEHAFSYQETKVEMHSQAAPILEALGEPVSYTEEASCAFDGLDKTYYYGSFYLTTYPKDGIDYIQSLWFADDSVATEEGIRIGDSAEKVETAYGMTIEDNSCILTGKTSKLTILLSEGAVSSILYEALMEP